uniref:Uncharacterized protein n=1 Tax=Anguilla anguilla TaxID=7936 RepID=A0A0E9SP01_ANGAN
MIQNSNFRFTRIFQTLIIHSILHNLVFCNVVTCYTSDTEVAYITAVIQAKTDLLFDTWDLNP